MSDSSIKSIINLLNSIFFNRHYFKWDEFIYPSTLLITPVVKILIEPVKSKESLARIELGLHEVLVNSVQHGNSNDSNKILRIRRIITPTWFVWQIQDEGKGLPLAKRICSLPLNIDAQGGRGLYLIRKCFDDVRWSPKGNRLQVSIKRSIF